MTNSREFLKQKYPSRSKAVRPSGIPDPTEADVAMLAPPPEPPKGESAWRKIAYFLIGMAVFYAAFLSITKAAEAALEFLRTLW